MNHLTVGEEWKLKSKINEVHMTSGVTKLLDCFPFHHNKSSYRSFSNKSFANFALMGMLLMPANTMRIVYENNVLNAIITIKGFQVIFNFKSITVTGSSAVAVRASPSTCTRRTGLFSFYLPRPSISKKRANQEIL